MSTPSGVLFELSNTIRLSIMRAVSEEAFNVTGLSRHLDITTQECSRHLARLSEIKLVSRTPDGLYKPTPYGWLALQHLSAYEFTGTHRDYFTGHDLSMLPQSFIHRLGELNNSVFMDDVMQIVHNVQNVINESEEYVLRVTDRYVFSNILPIEAAIKRGVEFRLVEQIDVTYTEVYSRETINRLIPGKTKVIPEAPIFLAMNEREVAALGFRLVKGRFDYTGFRSGDPEFHKWCVDLFEHYWDRTEGKTEYLTRIEAQDS